MTGQERILITGALGQIGTELTAALRTKYGNTQVIATDIQPATKDRLAIGHYEKLDVTNSVVLNRAIARLRPTQIYHLAAILSATGEQDPLGTWDINMQSLLDILEAARNLDQCKVFFPSSIAVFGNNCPKAFCSQHVAQQPGTVYGISKAAGELWCQYYYQRYGLDVRSLRYPGLISHSAQPGGGTTDYAVAIFHAALKNGHYTCYLQEQTLLPMMYMPDAIRATLALMDAPGENLSVRTSYNLWGITFDPGELTAHIRHYLPDFRITYAPDHRQAIADSWPTSINGHQAAVDWQWKHRYYLQDMVADMLYQLGDQAIKDHVEKMRPLTKESFYNAHSEYLL